MYGRGTSDMKGGTAAIVVAAERIAALGEGAAGLELVLCAGEETGCEGALALTGALGRCGAVLVAEPTTNYPCVAHKGVVWADAVARGKTAHGSMPHLGENAIYKLARAVARLEDFALEADEHALLGLPTVSLGTFSGGININSVPDYATAGIDVRTVPGMDGDSVLAALRERLGDEVELEPRVVLDPIDTDPDDEWVRSVFEVMGPLIGETPEPRGLAYFTDAAALAPAYGTPADDHLRPGRRRAGPPHRRVVLRRGARGERRGPVRDRPALVRALALLLAAALCAVRGRRARARRLERRRQGRRARRRLRRPAADVPRHGRRRVRPRRRRADRQPAGAASRRCSRPATGAATAGATCSRAPPTACCCSTAATGAAGSWAASGEQIGSGWQSTSPRCSPRATGTATAIPTSSPAPPTARC